jgi:hypothetical protein
MKKILFILLILPLISLGQQASIKGAWGLENSFGQTVLMVTDQVFSLTAYNFNEKKFISSEGGTWRSEGNNICLAYDWSSKDTAKVGKEIKVLFSVSPDLLTLGLMDLKLKKLDQGSPGALQGEWIISGNYTNDVVSKRSSPFFPRRTMKILTGNYFQWIAFNVKTKEFFGTGGGTYTTSAEGKYAESIQFFTKAMTSIGKRVEFNYSFQNGDWRHKGQKSTGGPLDECWTPRKFYVKIN